MWRWILAFLIPSAKSLQLCLTLCDPIDGSSVPGILQARILEWVAISFSNAWKWNVKVKWLSCAWLLATPWTVAYRLLCPWDFPGKSTGVGCRYTLYQILNPTWNATSWKQQQKSVDGRVSIYFPCYTYLLLRVCGTSSSELITVHREGKVFSCSSLPFPLVSFLLPSLLHWL